MPKSVELSGTGVRAFLHALVRSEPAASKELADAVAKRGAAAIRRMLVVRDGHHAWRRSQPGTGRRITSSAARDLGAPTMSAPAATVSMAPAAEAPSSALPTTPPIAFDPYAFAIEAILIKQGEAALAERLELVTEAGHLRALARAQRINLDPEIAGDPDATPSVLRQAILRGAGKRLADRRAAAGWRRQETGQAAYGGAAGPCLFRTLAVGNVHNLL